MRVSINAIDGAICVDGTSGTTDTKDLLSKGISAVQWNDNAGEIEYVRHEKPNEKILTFRSYQQYIDKATWPPPPIEPIPPPPPPELGPPVDYGSLGMAPIEQVLFDFENRLRALENKPQLSETDFMEMWRRINEVFMAKIASLKK